MDNPENLSIMGGCVVSNNIINGTGKLKWCVRDESANPVDSGWRFFSNIDTDEYLEDAKNMSIWNFDKIVEIEPAVLLIHDMPAGTDVALISDGNRKFFIHSKTGLEVSASE